MLLWLAVLKCYSKNIWLSYIFYHLIFSLPSISCIFNGDASAPLFIYTFDQALRFDFVSVGKEVISKSVVYTQTDIDGLYLLALVDVYADGSADDMVVSDNGDMEKILVTVFQTLQPFFDAHPNTIVGFEGSTPSRTRLYRIAITHELENIVVYYNVWGILSTGYEPFRRNRPYIGFLLSLKGINIA